MKKGEWLLGAVIVGAMVVYGIGQVTKSNRQQRDARLDAQVASDQAIRALCKDAAAKTLGSPVLDWDDSWAASPYSRVEKTSTGYRARVAADTGGVTNAFTCYIAEDLSLQRITRDSR